jgi:hypothetical protein
VRTLKLGVMGYLWAWDAWEEKFSGEWEKDGNIVV